MRMSFITGSIKNIMADGEEAPYTDQTICTFHAQGHFNLSLRATQGLLDSLFELMNVPLCAPTTAVSASAPVP